MKELDIFRNKIEIIKEYLLLEIDYNSLKDKI